MNPITIPYHLFIPFLTSILLLLIIAIRGKKIFRKTNRKSLWISIIFFLLIYSLIVGSAMFDDIYYQWDVNKYDLNMNGIFESNEINSSQQDAYQRLINDTGRNFSFLTGLIFSGIISLTVYIIGKGFEKYARLRKEEKTTHNKGCI